MSNTIWSLDSPWRWILPLLVLKILVFGSQVKTKAWVLQSYKFEFEVQPCQCFRVYL